MRRLLCFHVIHQLLLIAIIGISTFTTCHGLVPHQYITKKRYTTIHSSRTRILAATTTDGTNTATTIVDEQLTKQLGSAFARKLVELEEYKEKHGDCLVPRRYEENPSLGNFVNKQRQSYRKFLKGEKSSMNDVSSKMLCIYYVVYAIQYYLECICQLIFHI